MSLRASRIHVVLSSTLLGWPPRVESTRMSQPPEKRIGKRTRNLFDATVDKPFKLSRSEIELFLQCPLCFYLDRRPGVGRVQGPPFTLNTAVDALFKKEFDGYRVRGEPHPLMTAIGVNAIPFAHPELDVWRENFQSHKDTSGHCAALCKQPHSWHYRYRPRQWARGVSALRARRVFRKGLLDENATVNQQ